MICHNKNKTADSPLSTTSYLMKISFDLLDRITLLFFVVVMRAREVYRMTGEQ